MRIKERPRDVANMWETTVDNWFEEEETGLAAKSTKMLISLAMAVSKSIYKTTSVTHSH